MATLTNGGMGTVRILFPLPSRSTNTQRPSLCWMCLDSSAASSLRRRAQPRSTARIAVPFSFGRLDHGLSKQVARLFPGEPVPCPGAGLADALEGQDSLAHAVKPDVHIRRFVSTAVGQTVGDVEALTLLEVAGDHLAWPLADLDYTVWDTLARERR